MITASLVFGCAATTVVSSVCPEFYDIKQDKSHTTDEVKNIPEDFVGFEGRYRRTFQEVEDRFVHYWIKLSDNAFVLHWRRDQDQWKIAAYDAFQKLLTHVVGMRDAYIEDYINGFMFADNVCPHNSASSLGGDHIDLIIEPKTSEAQTPTPHSMSETELVEERAQAAGGMSAADIVYNGLLVLAGFLAGVALLCGVTSRARADARAALARAADAEEQLSGVQMAQAALGSGAVFGSNL